MESTTSTKKIIRISVEFQWFGQIDTANEKFQCRIRIESKWYENELMTEYNSKIDWNPLLYIENCCYEKFQKPYNSITWFNNKFTYLFRSE